MASIIWLARHGNREDFVDPNWREHAALPADSPLSSDGIDQARRLGRRLRREGIGAIYASPFLRAVQTAHEIADILELGVHLEPGLGEHLNPEWFAEAPGLHPISELQKQFARLVPHHPPAPAPCYPETLASAYRRSADAVGRIAAQVDVPVLFVGHGASVSGAVLVLAGEQRETPCPLAGLFALRRTGTNWKVELRADTAHLDAVPQTSRFF